MSADQPPLSVLIRVYNAEAYVAQAIQSVLDQTYPHFELLVVDDGSTDRSPLIVRAFAAQDRRIRLITQPNGGAGRAWNTGVAAARAPLLAVLDADDVALPHRLATQLEWMERTGVDLCGSCVSRIGGREGSLWCPETHQAIAHELLFRTALLPSRCCCAPLSPVPTPPTSACPPKTMASGPS